MDLGCVILCPERNANGLKTTVRSVTNHCYKRECLAVVPEDITAAKLKEMKEICTVHKGKNTIASLINVGVKKCKHEWSLLLFENSRVQPYVERWFRSFANTETSVLFPVVEMKCDFIEGCFNGVLLNTAFFKKVGDFPEIAVAKVGLNDFELVKLLWAWEAMKHGVIFKGIVGMKVL